MPDLSSLRLRIVPLDQILLHEAHHEYRVQRILAAMREDGLLRNPIMVTEHGGRYIQLDGATRAIALREMGIPHVAVQIVGYEDPQISLDSWNHILIGYPFEQLCTDLSGISGVRAAPCRPEAMRPALGDRAGGALLGLLGRDRESMILESKGEHAVRFKQMAQAVALYREIAEVRRTSESDLLALISQHPDLSAVVIFPPLEPADVILCATGSTKLPMGITRHVVSGRALGLNVPLDILAEDKPLEQKNAWLQETVLERIRKHKVRVYQEPVIIFDD